MSDKMSKMCVFVLFEQQPRLNQRKQLRKANFLPMRLYII